MARSKFGALITQASGSIGGQTFQKNRSGTSIRNKPFPIDPSSQSQLTARSFMRAIHSAWASMTDAQRNSWKFIPEQFPAYCKNNSGALLSGRELFIKWNYLRLSAGLEIVIDITGTASPSSDITINFFVDELSFVLGFGTSPVSQDKNYILELGRFGPANYVSKEQSFKKITGTELQPDYFDIRQNYVSKFGEFPQENDFINGSSKFFRESIPVIYPGRKIHQLPLPMASLSPGLSWVNMGNPSSSNNCTGVFNGENGVCIATYSGTGALYRSVNYGKTFTVTTFPPATSGYWFALYLGNDIWIASSAPNCNIVRSTDNGLTWFSVYSNPSINLCREFIICNDNSIVGCCATPCAILRSTNAGLTFTLVYTIPTDTTLISICNTATDRIIVATRNTKELYYSDNFGLNWALLYTFIGHTLIAGIRYIGNSVLISGVFSPYGYYRSSNNGLSWTFFPFASGTSVVKDLVSINDYYVVGTCSNVPFIIVSNDAGLTFTRIGPLFSQTSLSFIAYLGNGSFATGSFSGGLIVRSKIFTNA